MFIITLLSLLKCMNNRLGTIQLRRTYMKRKEEVEDDSMLYCWSSHRKLK